MVSSAIRYLSLKCPKWPNYTQNRLFGGNWATLGTLVRDIGEPMIPLDRARPVVLGTSLEQLEHVLERIRGRITSPKACFRG